MTSQLQEPFCPLYREARAAAPWKSAQSAHAGLLFDKFADAWWQDHEWRYAFDKGNRTKRDRDKQAHEKENYWLQQLFPKRYKPDAKLTAEACFRQRQLIEHLSGKTLLLTNTDRFVTGMGREHPLENGFAWHHTLGVPYLPGSSLKGILRAWLRETEGEIGKDKHGKDVYRENHENCRCFGTRGEIGQLILFDMLPLSPPALSVDIMTPHYGPYYQGDEAPGDWHSPVPITFLTVADGQSWQLGIAPRPGVPHLSDDVFQRLADNLIEALEIAGAGAKTAVGYGRFVVDSESQQRLEHEAERQRKAAEEAVRRAAERAAFEESLANDSEPLRKLKRLKRDQNWQRSAGDGNMIQALHEFADQHAELPPDCLDWIREWLESIPNYKGVWNDPGAMRGKKKDKPKYPSKAIRELVYKLKNQ